MPPFPIEPVLDDKTGRPTFRGAARARARGEDRPDLVAGRAKLTARTLDLLEKVMAVIVAGGGEREVAAELKLSRARAAELVDEALTRRFVDVEQEKERTRTVILARLDAMIRGLWHRRDEPYVVKVLIELEDRRAKLLGLDAPVETKAHVTVDVPDAELLARAAAFGIALGAGAVVAGGGVAAVAGAPAFAAGASACGAAGPTLAELHAAPGPAAAEPGVDPGGGPAGVGEGDSGV